MSPKSRRFPTIIIAISSSILLIAAPAKSQLVPDNTLGAESSRVVPVNSNRNNIEGGARRGTNLFHSFSEFNVNPGREVYFNNNPGIQNIINRVIGSNVSNIFGTLGANGNANLYLINPNGIVFGNGAKLDINGTFIGTTAEGIRLGTNDVYSAVNPANSSLLTIRPEALFINRIRAAQKVITNQGNLEINNGGNIRLSADSIENNGTIAASGGNVFLEAVNGNINTRNIATANGINGGGNISLFAEGEIKINGSIDASGGNFQINNRGEIVSLSPQIYRSGRIKIEAEKRLDFQPNSRLLAIGDLGGAINLKTNGQLSANQTTIISLSRGNVAQKAGDIKVFASTIDFKNSLLRSLTEGSANTGNMAITARNIQLKGLNINGDVSGFFNQTNGAGNAGQIAIATGSLLLKEGAQISTNSFGRGGNAGNINIIATEMELLGASPSNNIVTGIFARVARDSSTDIFAAGIAGQGNAGNLTINTNSLRLDRGAQVDASILLGSGNGGNLTISAREIELNSANPNNPTILSGLFSTNFGVGNGGKIEVNTDLLSLDNGAAISVGTFRKGNGGNINIIADRIELNGISPIANVSTGLFANAFDFFPEDGLINDGNGGTIDIITKQLTITDRAVIIAGNFRDIDILSPPGRGSAGNISIDATEVILNRGRISANGNVKGNGEITIDSSKFIILENGSEISTNIGQTREFPGGNIIINTPVMFATPSNNIISATALSSSGGNININTNAIFGYPQFLTIDASSDLGIDGTIAINGITDEFTKGSVLTLTPIIDAEAIIANDICDFKGDRVARGSTFTIPGKGGITPNPLENVERNRNLVEWSKKPDSEAKFNRHSTPKSKQLESKPLQPAVGWYRRSDGAIVLTANPAEVRPLNQPVSNPSGCDK